MHKGRNPLLIGLVCLIGAVVGTLAGETTGPAWLNQSILVGSNPLVNVSTPSFAFSFGLSFKLSLAGAAGLVGALIFVLRKA